VVLCVAEAQKKLGAEAENEAETMTESRGSRMMLDRTALMWMMMMIAALSMATL